MNKIEESVVRSHSDDEMNRQDLLLNKEGSEVRNDQDEANEIEEVIKLIDELRDQIIKREVTETQFKMKVERIRSKTFKTRKPAEEHRVIRHASSGAKIEVPSEEQEKKTFSVKIRE